MFTVTGYKANFNLRNRSISGSNITREYEYSPTGTSTVWDIIILATFNGHLFTVKTPLKEELKVE